jgi:putative transcriptional regulator
MTKKPALKELVNIEFKLLELMGKNKIRNITELHRKTGLSKTLLSDLINENKKVVRLDTILRLCVVLNCEIHELIKIKKA